MSELKQKLLLYELAKIGFRDACYISESDRIKVQPDNDRMPFINEPGNISYSGEHHNLVKNTIRPLVHNVYEILGAWEKSQTAPFEGVSNFRLLAEYNNIVLCARDDTEKGYGLHFVTWECNPEHTSVEYGHYTQDYDWAKQDFSIRAGLIAKEKIFTPEQAAELKEAIDYCLHNNSEITLKTEDMLTEISAKLNTAYPEKDTSAEKSAYDGVAVNISHFEPEKTEKTSLLAQLAEKTKEVKPTKAYKKDGEELS